MMCLSLCIITFVRMDSQKFDDEVKKEEVNLDIPIFDTSPVDSSDEGMVRSIEEIQFKFDNVDILVTDEINNIRLYGKEGNLLKLFLGEESVDIIAKYSAPRDVLTTSNLLDIDKDDKNEICIITTVGSGTGVSIQELHVIEMNPLKEKISIDNAKVGDVFLNLIDTNINFINDETYIIVDINNHKTEVNITALISDLDNSKITDTAIMGYFIRYELINEEVVITMPIALFHDDVNPPIYYGELQGVLEIIEDKVIIKKVVFLDKH